VLDLSLAAAKALHMTGRGLLKVTAAVEPATTTFTTFTPVTTTKP
jgi:rare lipoprotein A (peptidoglycan hydrolase)